jgi:hypothetical protein
MAEYQESSLRTGLIDFPNIFQWFFNNWSEGPSIAEMGIAEADMIFHHTRSVVRKQVLETGIMFPHQYGLIQKVAEQDLMLYLFTLLMQPKGRRNFRLMAYPQALFYSQQDNLHIDGIRHRQGP